MRVIWIGGLALQGFIAAGAWLVGQTDGGSTVVDKVVFPAISSSAVAGLLFFLMMRFLAEQKTERVAHAADLKAERDASAAAIRAERESHSATFRTEREAHVLALRAERDAHMAEISREREESKRLYDRLLDKVIPTLEATIHALNEVRTMAARDRLDPELVERLERVVQRAGTARGAEERDPPPRRQRGS